MFEHLISKEDKRLLQLFNQYDSIINMIYDEIHYENEHCGLICTTINRNDFQIITEEMESYFKGKTEFEIEIDWNTNCDLFTVNWNYSDEN